MYVHEGRNTRTDADTDTDTDRQTDRQRVKEREEVYLFLTPSQP